MIYLRALLKLTLVVCFMFIILTTAMGQESNYTVYDKYGNISATIKSNLDKVAVVVPGPTTQPQTNLGRKVERSYNTDNISGTYCYGDSVVSVDHNGVTLDGTSFPYSGDIYTKAYDNGNSFIIKRRKLGYGNYEPGIMIRVSGLHRCETDA